MRYAAVTVILAGLATLLVKWVGPAFNWAEWLVLVLIAAGAAGVLMLVHADRHAPYGYEDSHGYHDGKPDDWFVSSELEPWPLVERRSEDRSLRHPGLGK